MRKSLICIRQTLFIAATVCAFSVVAVAVSLSEYRDNIVHLRDDLDQIISPAEDSTDKENLDFEQQVLEEFPELLPARDKIEWQDSTVEVNNQWIYDALDRFKKEPLESPKRAAILIEINERLAALERKLTELENPSAATRTKDEDKLKLAEILRREEYQKAEEKGESFFQKLLRQLDEWMSRNFPTPQQTEQAAGGFQSLSFVLQMLLYAVILGGIGFLIYRFAPFLFDRFQMREKREKKERVILGERIAANETAHDLFTAADRLAREGNLRGAIRKGYIALLCELSDRKVIGLSQHKTNRDYLRDVRKKTELHRNMSGLTNNYERHWYGFETAKEQDWEEFKTGYKEATCTNQ
jgi:hypothetical protein